MVGSFNIIGWFNGPNLGDMCNHYGFTTWSNEIISEVSISKDENIVTPLQKDFEKVTIKGVSLLSGPWSYGAQRNQGLNRGS